MGNLIKNQTSTTKLKLKDFVSTNLTKREKELLVSIFSDSEAFKPNQTIYKKRLNVDVRTIQRLCKSLTQKGYLTIKQLSGYNNYQWTVYQTPINQPEKVETINTIPEIEELNIIDLEKVNYKIEEVINKYFPNITEKIVDEYYQLILNAIDNNKVKESDFTELKIKKSLSKFYQEPIKEEPIPANLSIKEMEMIVNNKMYVGTKNQRECTMNKMRDWFIQNGCIANEEEIRAQTFKTHSESKTSGRNLDQRYQD